VCSPSLGIGEDWSRKPVLPKHTRPGADSVDGSDLRQRAAVGSDATESPVVFPGGQDSTSVRFHEGGNGVHERVAGRKDQRVAVSKQTSLIAAAERVAHYRCLAASGDRDRPDAIGIGIYVAVMDQSVASVSERYSGGGIPNSRAVDVRVHTGGARRPDTNADPHFDRLLFATLRSPLKLPMVPEVYAWMQDELVLPSYPDICTFSIFTLLAD
jgi:hypothetical protein